MHKEDQMTPNQRLQAFMTGGEMDRILSMPLIVSILHRVVGMTHKEKRSSAENEAAAHIGCYKKYGNDILIIEYGLHGIGRALGNKMTDPEDSVPAIEENVLKDLDDLDKLDFSLTTKDKDPELQRILEVCRICKEKVGDEVPIGVLISGPFTAAASVYPVEKMLKASRKSPEKVHALLRKATDALKGIYVDFIKEGIIIIQCDPISSGSLLHINQYREFVKPYASELNETIVEAGGVNVMHMCGDISKTIHDIVETGGAMLSIDNVVDMEFAKNEVGNQLPLLGNVDPVGVLLHGSKEEVFEAVKETIRKGYDSPKGFILASGCDITQNVLVENIDAFMEASRIYGKYPLDKELLGIEE
ncbi:uroporphyrinogen decarboxylase [Tissierella creatinini]|nr:uroporphyrinogen decarboxylase [Tissierella creatinini]TJX64585.1 uroporphyrinogen decarboxylase [Soehngenia saccharolytica]